MLWKQELLLVRTLVQRKFGGGNTLPRHPRDPPSRRSCPVGDGVFLFRDRIHKAKINATATGSRAGEQPGNNSLSICARPGKAKRKGNCFNQPTSEILAQLSSGNAVSTRLFERDYHRRP